MLGVEKIGTEFKHSVVNEIMENLFEHANIIRCTIKHCFNIFPSLLLAPPYIILFPDIFLDPLNLLLQL